MNYKFNFLILSTFISIQAEESIFVNWIGRFGNNLFQFATAYSIAKSKGLVVYAYKNNDLEVFSLPYVVSPDQYRRVGSVFDESRINNGNSLIQTFNEDIFKLSPNTSIVGFFQTDKYFIQYRNDLIKLYTFKESEYYDEARKKLNAFGGLSLCAHLRFGDYKDCLRGGFEEIDDKLYQKKEFVFPVMDSDYYIRALSLIFEKISTGPSLCTLFIITDELTCALLPAILMDIQQTYNNLRIVVTDSDEQVNFAMMNLCDACITSASSFSWWGAWLNTNAKIIISPKYWFNYYLPHKKIILPNDIEMSLGNQFFIESKGYCNFLIQDL